VELKAFVIVKQLVSVAEAIPAAAYSNAVTNVGERTCAARQRPQTIMSTRETTTGIRTR